MSFAHPTPAVSDDELLGEGKFATNGKNGTGGSNSTEETSPVAYTPKSKGKGGKAPKTPSPKKRAANDNVETPSSNKKRSPTKATPSSVNATGTKDAADGSPATPSKSRKRAPLKYTPAKTLTIPLSWEEAGEADRALVQMREAGEGWPAIRKMWKEKTGQDTGNSTLPNRYNRVKANMTQLKEGDALKLLIAKETIDAELDAKKWALIAAHMEKDGADKYSVTFLQKKWKEIEANGSIANLGGKSATKAGASGVKNGGKAPASDEYHVPTPGGSINGEEPYEEYAAGDDAMEDAEVDADGDTVYGLDIFG